MPTSPHDFTLWAKLWDFIQPLLTFSVVVGLIAAAAYVVRSLSLIRFTVRAIRRSPADDPEERGRRRQLRQLTALLAALWYLKELVVPQGLRHWLLGEVTPGIPPDHRRLTKQESDARRAAKLLLNEDCRIVIFTGDPGWGKTHTSHDLKARLAPLAQIDVSWTMISSNPEGRIVEEFTRVLKDPTLAGAASLSFDHLKRLTLIQRSTISPHFFAHIHDFEAIAVESRSLASARRLIERVRDSQHISLVITTRDDEKRLGELLPILDPTSPAANLREFIAIGPPLSDTDIRTLLHLSTGDPVPPNAFHSSPLELILWQQCQTLQTRGRPGSHPAPLGAPSGFLQLYRQLFSYLPPAQQVSLQLLLARLAVSPERLFVRKPEELLAQLFVTDQLLRLFAYVEGGVGGDAVARLAHPTVLQLYSDAKIMSAATRQRRHGQWADVLAGSELGPAQTFLYRLQLVRHQLRAGRGRPDHEDAMTSASYGETLAICRFLFECRSDFHECFPKMVVGSGEAPSKTLLKHDGTQGPKEYLAFVEALLAHSASMAIWNVKLKNLTKMMELLYQGLDAWKAAEVLALHLSQSGEPWVTYGLAMQAVFEFDYNGETDTAIAESRKALAGWQRGSGRPSHQSPFTWATILINQGIFQNNQFGKNAAADRAGFDDAGRLYEQAEQLIVSEMDREDRAEYRFLMLRERLRVASGLLRWTYLKDGAADVNVKKVWEATCELVAHEAGWPTTMPLQEFAYFALNASFIELARKGPNGKWHDYYAQARNHQEAAGDRWFRLRLDQMGVVRDTLGDRNDAPEVRDGRRALESVIGEMRGMLDWTGIAFCAYQLTALGAARVDRRDVQVSYERHTRGVRSTPDFQSRTDREHLFDILCGPWTNEKARYFPAWEQTPMPLNLHGLLLLRSVSLLDQASWRRGGA